MGLEWLVKVNKMCSEVNNIQSMDESLNSPYSDGIREALDQIQYNFVITDPSLSDHPIVYASEGFLKMTGYSKGEVVGKNSRFLQGPDTDRRTVLEIREAIREEKSCQVSILNYRKDGTTFWILFNLAPVFCKENGRVIHFVGVQTLMLKVSGVLRPRSSNNVACTRPHNCPAHVGNRNFNCHASHGDSSNNLILFGSCRRELFRDFPVDMGYSRLYNSSAKEDSRGLGEEETCQPSESDKQKAITAVNSILSELIHFSNYTGRIVSGTRGSPRDPERVAPICSSLLIALGRIQQSFVLVDPHLPGMPIVHASDLFLQLTGYSRDEVLGQNCRFLQGAGTDQAAVAQIRQSIKSEQTCTVRILNYRKDGNPFWNFLHTAPVRNASGKVAFYVGVQLDVTSIDQDEHQDKGMTPHMKQLGAVGAVRVAVRSLLGAGPSR